MFRYPFTRSKLPASLRQRHSSDCGPTCLAMVAHYFHPPSSELTNLPAVAHPATAAEMVDLAMLVGLSASPCKVAMDELARLKTSSHSALEPRSLGGPLGRHGKRLSHRQSSHWASLGLSQ